MTVCGVAFCRAEFEVQINWSKIAEKGVRRVEDKMMECGVALRRAKLMKFGLRHMEQDCGERNMNCADRKVWSSIARNREQYRVREDYKVQSAIAHDKRSVNYAMYNLE